MTIKQVDANQHIVAEVRKTVLSVICRKIVHRGEASRQSAGFSLIELLVVVAILAILAAVAIPLFLNQKSKSYLAVAQTDLRNLIPQVESDPTRPAVGSGNRWVSSFAGVTGNKTKPANVLTGLSGVQYKTGSAVIYIAWDCKNTGSGSSVDSPGDYILWEEAINNITPDAVYDSSSQKWYLSTSNTYQHWGKITSCPNGFSIL